MTVSERAILEIPDSVEQVEEQDTGVRPYQWTVEAFYRAIERGAFEHPERLELMDGEIIEKVAAQETPHIIAVGLTADLLRSVFGTACHIRVQTPLNVNEKTEPEPDIMVVRGGWRDNEGRKPNSNDVLLLVEVSDTTLGYDRNRKAVRYARAGVEEYWVLGLRNRWLEVRRDPFPTPGEKNDYGYKATIRYEENDTVSPLHAPEAKILVSELLPRG